MFQKKKILFMLLIPGLLMSCGGDDTANSAAAPAGVTGAPAAATSTSSNGSGSSPSVPNASNTSPAASPVNANSVVAVDQQLNGYLEMVGDQILYIRTNRVLYHPVAFPEFESDRGIVDVASGSLAAPPIDINIGGCNVAKDGKCGIQPPAAAPAAPIAAFGIRISKFVQPSTPGQTVGNQTVIGRIALDLTERTNSPGIGANEVPEIMRFVIDNVKLSINANGELVSVQMQEGAKIHVYGRNADGSEVQDDIPAPDGTVRLMPISLVPDSNGDTSSVILLLDLETGFSKADAKLAVLKNIAGHFSMNLTLSSLQKIVRPAASAAADYPAVEQKDLIGQQIVVNNQPPVTGAGIVGNAWIRMYPAQ